MDRTPGFSSTDVASTILASCAVGQHLGQVRKCNRFAVSALHHIMFFGGETRLEKRLTDIRKSRHKLSGSRFGILHCHSTYFLGIKFASGYTRRNDFFWHRKTLWSKAGYLPQCDCLVTSWQFQIGPSGTQQEKTFAHGCVCVWRFWTEVKPLLLLLFQLSDFSRGLMGTWMAWANEGPSKLLCKRACNLFIVMGCGQPKNYHAVFQRESLFIDVFTFQIWIRHMNGWSYSSRWRRRIYPFTIYKENRRVRCYWSAFARQMHSTTEFAMTVPSTCVTHVDSTRCRELLGEYLSSGRMFCPSTWPLNLHLLW